VAGGRSPILSWASSSLGADPLLKEDWPLAGFEQDIRPLFREYDRTEMEWAFDLWDYDDVKENAEAILERLVAGDMPCDGPLSEEEIEKFRKWMGEGMEP
jgi:hypothetical protein